MGFKRFFENVQVGDDFSNRKLVVVDIQPAYENEINFLDEFVEFLNEKEFNDIIYFFNGEELGMDKKHEVQLWLVENGLEEDKLEDIFFVDKSYAFFRSAMDLGYDLDEMKAVLKVMKHFRLNDIRELEETEHWELLSKYVDDIENWKEFVESGDSIYFPSFHEEPILMQRLNGNLVLCGGGEFECLAEIAIYLDILDLKYQKLDKFIF